MYLDHMSLCEQCVCTELTRVDPKEKHDNAANVMETILQLCQVTTNDWPHHKANSSKGNQMTLHFQLIHRMCHVC